MKEKRNNHYEVDSVEKVSCLPCEFTSVKEKLAFSHDGEVLYTLNIRLDNQNPDFKAYIDLSRYNGMELDISVLPDMPIFFEETDEMNIENAYHEQFRPQIHFTTKNGWLNDPNGLIYVDGVYHMFYQYNPCEADWDNIHWGHAVSTDMLHWEEKDIALFPDKTGIKASGSAITDEKNLLGLQTGTTPAVLLFYTATLPSCSQHLAYSADNLKTIKQYSENPLVPHISARNRDPKVIYCDELEAYIMALYFDSDIYAILKSDNLTDWEVLQEIQLKGDRECPDVFPLTTHDGVRKWVLIGARDIYLICDVKDGKFVPCQKEKALAYGISSYAGQSFSNMPDGRRIRMVWDRCRLRTTKFTSQMLIPMELGLVCENGEFFITAQPVKELEKLYGKKNGYENITVKSDKDTVFTIKPTPNLFRIKGKIKDGITLSFNIAGLSFTCSMTERSIEYTDNVFGKQSAPLASSGNCFELTVITDMSSLEIYSDGGKAYTANCEAFFDCNVPYLTISSNGDYCLDSIEVTDLKSVWDN